MSLDQHIYGPSSTPKSLTFPDGSLKTPKTESFPHSHFLDAWATPRPNGQHTPVQTPSFTLSTPIGRPSSSYSQPVRTPEDPEFHVNHFAPQNLPLPPVDVSRRLSSSPGPNQLRKVGSQGQFGSRPVSMDFSQMQTPPPTRDASSRRGVQQSGHGVATPATVVHRTPSQLPESSGALFDQTPFGFADLQYTPHMMQFPSGGPMSAPPMPQSKLFWDPAHDGMQMDLDVPLGVDPFGPTPHRPQHDMNWQAMNHPLANMMQTPVFQGFQASPMPASFANTPSQQRHGSRNGSFVYTAAGVDPNMLLSFSNPDMTGSFGSMPQQPMLDMSRQPYETQLRDAENERAMAKKAKSQHSRSNTASSSGSAENARPVLQRSNTDSGPRITRVMDPRIAIPANASTIPRRSSPLKRQSGGSLKAIPEIRRPRTRLIIDESGTARTETIPSGDDETPRNRRQTSQQDLRRQYPGLYEEQDSESDDDEPAPIVSRNPSFVIPQPERRATKHARADSGGLERANSFKMARSVSASRLASDALSKSSFETLRSTRRSAAAAAENTIRRSSAMERPSLRERDPEDIHMPDSPGDALGALKKVVGARQQRIGTLA
ncbi:hypothetical protein J4E86_008483 [Alternaria arbusti]|uniref:uncharacterized protein n=1 Tax=Alternaria arbusti TaxID=232088 RepID=UPI00221F7C6A|nr:uncharacterized protein J4E86_008483 [Alternaria arbusti]KAI4947965.1 hypothetical protein J4E86_008483 [Alternaria arbusti]